MATVGFYSFGVTVVPCHECSGWGWARDKNIENSLTISSFSSDGWLSRAVTFLDRLLMWLGVRRA